MFKKSHILGLFDNATAAGKNNPSFDKVPARSLFPPGERLPRFPEIVPLMSRWILSLSRTSLSKKGHARVRATSFPMVVLPAPGMPMKIIFFTKGSSLIHAQFSSLGKSLFHLIQFILSIRTKAPFPGFDLTNHASHHRIHLFLFFDNIEA